MSRVFACLILAIGLAACSTEGLIDTAFPDRERFAFRSADGETIVQYACEPKGSTAATKANATRAHRSFDRRYNQLIDSVVADVLAGTNPNSAALSRRIDTEAERIVKATEDQYQCLAYDFRDT